MKRVRFLSAAREEFLAEVAYYSTAQQGLGTQFALAVEEATIRALAFPLAGSPSAAKSRHVNVRRFPFSIFYRVEADGIVIFAVAHHARRPNYWHGRRV